MSGMGKIAEAFVNIGRACTECVKTLSEAFSTMSTALREGFEIYMLPNSRIKHLALYAKKKRVRKKNYKRLLKEVRKHDRA